MSVRALVVDPTAPGAVRLAEVSDPTPGPGQVLVAVSHASLNYGDLNDARSGRVPEGAVLGSDAAGVVVQAAADGSGPAVGTRVVALTSGAFAERVAIDVGALAEVPKALDLARAVALPVAAVAALRSLRAAGLGPDKTVLVTGASGGVGRFAVQLAARAGAHVIASVGSAARGKGLAEAGADDVLIGLEGLRRPVDVVIDSVGGPQLVAAWNLLSPGGSVQSRLDLRGTRGLSAVRDRRPGQVPDLLRRRRRRRRGPRVSHRAGRRGCPHRRDRLARILGPLRRGLQGPA
ncbi:alcohol dehydrogenase catalytic domain-containing protein [Streptomyces sp. MBT49]|uniref:alcohol dehydrogenase catalytic domain-containing protein n=1 Tax=Streptomyces sp. MBT49 TaxID=1488380 RepID=UPI001F41D56A|nr:zinc-binding dehydrogenase [Streptomyces sp. MBT49]